MWGYYGMSGFNFIGGLFSIIFWILIIWLIIAGIRWFAGPRHHGGHRRNFFTADALDILRTRYAKGEIDKAEFEERKKTLEQ